MEFSKYQSSTRIWDWNQICQIEWYILTDVPYNSSFAGYKDWFIQDYNRPGYTIEAGLGENPLPITQFDEIYKNNLGILILGAISTDFL